MFSTSSADGEYAEIPRIPKRHTLYEAIVYTTRYYSHIHALNSIVVLSTLPNTRT